MQALLLPVAFCVSLAALQAQGTGLPLGSETYHLLDRLYIKTGVQAPFHAALKYHTRGDALAFALSLDSVRASLSVLDLADLEYLYQDNNEWLGIRQGAMTLAERRRSFQPYDTLTLVERSLRSGRYRRNAKPLLGIFYPTPANLIEVNHPHFHLRVNPLLNIGLAPLTNEAQSVFLNQRGVELRGGFDDRLYFYANILESQAAFPAYVVARIRRDVAVPGAALYKPYNSSVFNIKDGYDFLNGQGYIGFNITRHVGAQFGYGRHFIGNGYRSMLLSDFAQNYPFLRLNWRVWKLHYQNLFAELDLRSANQTRDGTLVSKKYMAAHHLSIKLGRRVQVGLFETVIFARPNHFALYYLNPVILYRVVEQATGSPDNVLIGMDGHWNLSRHLQVYGQFILDEFKFRELVTNNQGWWANKYGIQAGFKYVDAFGLDHLDLQAEFNTARPYTYTHRDSTGSYAHHNQPLAHPLGANFNEFLLMARYRPLPRLRLQGRVIHMRVGEDAPGLNWGNNILLDHDTRLQEYGNRTGQGLRADITLAGMDISYMLGHNAWLDLQYFYRYKKSEEPLLSNRLQYLGAGVRVNLAPLRMDF